MKIFEVLELLMAPEVDQLGDFTVEMGGGLKFEPSEITPPLKYDIIEPHVNAAETDCDRCGEGGAHVHRMVRCNRCGAVFLDERRSIHGCGL